MVFTFLTLYSMGGIQMIERDFTVQRRRDLENSRKVDNPSGASVERSRDDQAPVSPSNNELPRYEEKDSSARTTTPAALSKITSLDVNRPLAAAHSGNDETRTKWQKVWDKVKVFITVPSMTLLSALIISIVPYLRALFVTTKGVSMPNAPDGRPPLDFVIQMASYGGQLSPVMGLAMLGAALARIRVRHLPKGFWISIVSTCVLKLILGPILGIIWIQGLKNHSSLINDDQKMMQFVIAITGAMPAATSQVYITTLFAPDDSPEMSQLSASLLAQYALMIITLPIVTTYTLTNVI
ncbi:hypothetical protein ABW19_dt0208640 [Dactylella cylindrospora]|nr:hypothetical protein ABW19_dt0208640 [Dactylella cylindrospora]